MFFPVLSGFHRTFVFFLRYVNLDNLDNIFVENVNNFVYNLIFPRF